MKKILPIFFALILGCGQPENQPVVNHAGALKNFMHKGDISAKKLLIELKNKSNLYALGALENLKGEILIWDSQPIITFEQNEHMTFDSTFNKNAALLVWAQVDRWQSIAIPEEIKTSRQMEKFIESAAKQAGLNTNQPFPFLLSGTLSSLHWHIINWPENDNVHTHQKHRDSGPHGELSNVTCDILGFYSNRHHAIFTHHTTNMHLHFKSPDQKLAGHIDEFLPGSPMVLKLPLYRSK
ncbi:MAG: decarboxylase [Calditrichaeota bacterium]|nr:MAG: decarboxylase [Calditrichota bacterium]